MKNNPSPPVAARRSGPWVLAGLSAVFLAAGLVASSMPVASERRFMPMAEPGSPPRRLPTSLESTDRIIVRLRGGVGPIEPSPISGRRMAMSASNARALSSAAVTELVPVRVMADGGHVLRLSERMRLADVEAIAERIRRNPAVADVEPDRLKFPLQVPTDGRFVQQWNLTSALGGVNVQAAWNRGITGQSVVVAVVDTGIVPGNRDLTLGTSSRLLLPGYDFISADQGGAFATANDGDGRDGDASDPGNWITADEAGRAPFIDCTQARNSDWHGTHTAGIIAANANNDTQVGAPSVVGVAYGAQVLPIRALGKCGGYTSDIADGIRWAANIPVAGVPANPAGRAVDVINLSLGSPGACSSTDQAVITAALAAGVKAIVAAAGNEDGADAAGVSPANCTGVISVAATDRFGGRAPYSNIGPSVTLSAPGGCFDQGVSVGFTCGNSPQSALSGIISTSNAGTTGPVSADSYVSVIGTSEAAAHVSAVAALMVQANTSITSAQLRSFIAGSARPFPSCTCATSACGTGVVDADAAVRSVLAGSIQTSTAGTRAACGGESALAGRVFFDRDASGTSSGGDSGASGVTIILANAGGTEIARTTTSATGYYSFMSIAAGSYRLSKVQPADATGSGAVAGTAGGTAGINAVSGIALAASTYAGGYDFPLDAPVQSSGGGGGGGGCVAGDPARTGGAGGIDPLLALVAALCFGRILRNRRRGVAH